jgi:hypothetical protein
MMLGSDNITAVHVSGYGYLREVTPRSGGGFIRAMDVSYQVATIATIMTLLVNKASQRDG